MNTAQSKVLIGTACVVALMLIFPPYIIENYRGIRIRAGYDFIFSLPVHIGGYGTKLEAIVNVGTLSIQIFSTLIIGGLIFLAKGKLSN